MYYDPFVLPFTAGLCFLLAWLAFTYSRWIRSFSPADKRLIRRNILSLKTCRAVREVFMESLVHHRIFRTSPFLGYMHLCFGLGWFLLILTGKTESMVYHTSLFNPPYFAVFFRFFHPARETFPCSGVFAFLTDLFLLVILSGLLLAVVKRIRSRLLGMKRTTRLRPFDRLALSALWLIFPLRFLAESLTSGLRGGGGFLTRAAGEAAAGLLPLDQLVYPAWWAYSIVLGLFFVLLPFSRYMHIPTEVVYIFLKNWGLRQGKEFSGISRFQLYSCSRCGICLDQCQLGNDLGMKDVQPVHFLTGLRHGSDCSAQLENCLMCGRCEEACPVDLRLNAIRLGCREDLSRPVRDRAVPGPVPPDARTRVAYFAGCMGQLTPGITRAVRDILEKAGTDYTWIDRDGGICCGRPMLLTGNRRAAEAVIGRNRSFIRETGATLLLTSCPICYRTFREEYGLAIPVVDHSSYILQLIREGRLPVRNGGLRTVFHNPCELGRGCGVVREPEEVLEQVSERIATAYDGRKSLCCGGSLADIRISPRQRTVLAAKAAARYGACGPDVLVTACPLCKKTFSKTDSGMEVKDIAEIVAENC